jgi:hypothetical protein
MCIVDKTIVEIFQNIWSRKTTNVPALISWKMANSWCLYSFPLPNVFKMLRHAFYHNTQTHSPTEAKF